MGRCRVKRATVWRDRLDDRIDRCPGCDEWRWDRECKQCTKNDQEETE